MGISLNQLKTYTTSVLKNWLTNKDILDKISESETGNMLYDGKEITASSQGSAATGIGKKLYDITVGSNSFTGAVNANSDYSLLEDSAITSSDSIENYDAIIFSIANKASDDALVFNFLSKEIPVSFIKENYGKACDFIQLSNYYILVGFINANTLSIVSHDISNDRKFVINKLIGIKYEEVTAEVVTDEQVNTAATETLANLNTKNSQ